ncbi:MAG: hypothetical protein MUC35_04740 [Candidatus Margulisbacteria bacterium]|jgi:hypothetical protein|nr:hypothetical protein [Candidatus Margulisiibacteriota bacterium]
MITSSAQLSPGVPTADQPCIASQANTLGCLVSKILSRTAPTVVGFGEIHHDGKADRSTLEQFTREVVPLLRRRGFRHLVLEFLLSDQEVRHELAAYREARITLDQKQAPRLFAYAAMPEHRGFRELLATCRRLGITIHPGGPTSQEYYQPENQAELKVNKPWPRNVKLFGQSLAKAIGRILADGQKVASYSGLRHNDLLGSETAGSFVPALKQSSRTRYVEIDLIGRQLLAQQLHPLVGTQQDYAVKLREHEQAALSSRQAAVNPRPNQFTIFLR